MPPAAEEVSLLISLQDRASAGIEGVDRRLGALGSSGLLVKSGIERAAGAFDYLAAKGVAGVDRVIGKVATLAKWGVTAGVAFASWEIKSGVKTNAELEREGVMLQRLTGSAQKARELVSMGVAESFKGEPLQEQLAGLRMLETMGLDSKKWFEPLGDAAAALTKPLAEVTSAVRSFYMGTGEGTRALIQLGINPATAGMSLKPEDRIEDMDKLYAYMKSKFGGTSDILAGTFSGLKAGLLNVGRDWVAGFTRPLFLRMKEDLAGLKEYVLGGESPLGSLATRGGAALASLYDRASAGLKRFGMTGMTEGWGKAFKDLWKELEPEFVRGAKWLAGIFAHAFMATMKGLATGEGWAWGAAGYGGAKLLGTPLVNKAVGSAWDKLWGMTKSAGAVAGGGAAMGGAAAATQAAIAARLAQGGAAAGPPVEYLLGSGAAGAGAAKTGLLSKLLTGIGGAGGLAVGAAATLAALGLYSGYSAMHEQTTKGVEGANSSWINKAGAAMGNYKARDAIAKGDAAEASAQQYFAASQERIALDKFTRGRLGEMLGDYQGQLGKLGEISQEIETRRIAGTETVSAEMKDFRLKGALPEERQKSYLEDIASLQERIRGIDYAKLATADQVTKKYSTHVALLDQEYEAQKKLLGAMEEMKEKALSGVERALSMGPQKWAENKALADWYKKLTPEQQWAAAQDKTIREGVSAMGGWRETLGEEGLRRVGKNIPGMGEIPDTATAAAAVEAQQAKDRAAAAAAAEGRVSVDRLRVKVDIARVEYIISRQNPDALMKAVTQAIVDADADLVEKLKKLLADRDAAHDGQQKAAVQE